MLCVVCWCCNINCVSWRSLESGINTAAAAAAAAKSSRHHVIIVMWNETWLLQEGKTVYFQADSWRLPVTWRARLLPWRYGFILWCIRDDDLLRSVRAVAAVDWWMAWHDAGWRSSFVRLTHLHAGQCRVQVDSVLSGISTWSVLQKWNSVQVLIRKFKPNPVYHSEMVNIVALCICIPYTVTVIIL